MGFKSRILTRWSNFGDLLFRIIKRSGGVKDLIDAQLICDKHRKELSKGEINPQWYQ